MTQRRPSRDSPNSRPPRRPRPAGLARLLGADRGRARAAVGAGHLPGARQPHADPADPRGRRHAAARERASRSLLLVGVIGREVWRVFQARRRGRAGARLHVRIVALFSMIAAVPAILVAVVASVTLDRGLDRLFSQQTHSLIENSLIVAEAYVREHAQIVRADAIATAIELARAKPLFDQNREQFRQFLTAQAAIRGLPAIMMLRQGPQRHRPGRRRRSARSSSSRRAEALASVNDTEPQVGDVPRRQLRRRRHQAARLRRHLSLRRAPARSARGRAAAGDARGRQRNTPSSRRAASACRSPSR